MTRTRYDLTIIGGGSGGLTAARLAAALGAKVLLIDKERLGGDCLYTGCVPSKSLIHAARIVHQTRNATNLGLMSANFEVDLAKINHYIQTVIGKVAEGEKVYTKGVTVSFGEVSFQIFHRTYVKRRNFYKPQYTDQYWFKTSHSQNRRP